MSGLRVGVDVVAVERITELLQRRPAFADRVYTDRERDDAAGMMERLASRWAAKEAVRKVAGAAGEQPLPAFREIEVVTAESGAPSLRIRGRESDLALSLSHDAGIAVAVVVAPAGDALLRPPYMAPPAGLRLPPRPATGHKGTFGTVVVVAGAVGTAGAALLASLGAARGGAGLVRVCVPGGVYPLVAQRCLEVMAHPLGGASAEGLDAAGLATLRERHLGIAGAVVLGPGLGRAEPTGAAVLELLASVETPMVVDADGLNIAAAARFGWRSSAGPRVLTPHPAEMGRLAGIGTPDVQSDRERVARDYAGREGVVVVLKGDHTVVAAPDGRLHVDGHATVALATGGTGDVLAGLCGAMLAGGLEPFDAAVAAVTIHAEAGCALEDVRGRAGGLAGDLLEELPAAQERIRRALEAAG